MIIRAGAPTRKNQFKKIFAKVSQCRKPTHSTQHYLNTLPRTYPILTHRGEDPSRLLYPNLIHEGPPGCVACLYTTTKVFFEIVSQCRKTVPKTSYSISHYIEPNYTSRFSALGSCRLAIAYLNT